MGCDIHPYLELKFGDDWVYVGQVDSFRNYKLFAHLSGVRAMEGDTEAFFPVRENVPGDASEQVKAMFEAWGYNGHSLTVVPFEGLVRMFEDRFSKKRYSPKKPNLSDGEWERFSRAGGFLQDWLMMMSRLVDGGYADDARVILWYDN